MKWLKWNEIRYNLYNILNKYFCGEEDGAEVYRDIIDMMGEIRIFLENNAKQYEICTHTFDGGPGYECTHHVIFFTDRYGKLGYVDFLNESY